VVCGLQLYDILLIARWCRSFQQAIAKVVHFITSDALDKKPEIKKKQLINYSLSYLCPAFFILFKTYLPYVAFWQVGKAVCDPRQKMQFQENLV
jgi:hypothetical protein